MSAKSIMAGYRQMATLRRATIHLERPKMDPIRSGLARQRIQRAVARMGRKRLPIGRQRQIIAGHKQMAVTRKVPPKGAPSGTSLISGGKGQMAMVAGAITAGQSLLRAGQQFLGSPMGQQLISGIAGPLSQARGGAAVARKIHSAAWVENGRIYVPADTPSGKRILGYTPAGAKKKYKKRRRRKRLTQKDKYEWEMRLAIANVQAGKPGLPPVG